MSGAINTERASIFHKFSKYYHLVFGNSLEPGRKRVSQILQKDHQGSKILEVGVGTGLTLKHYPKGCNIIGIDLHEPMIEKARAHLASAHPALKCQLEVMDATQMSFADSSFDVVYAPSVLSVVNNPKAVLNEMLRVCKPSGHIIIICYAKKQRLSSRAIAAVFGPITNKFLGFHMSLDAALIKKHPQLELLIEEETNHLGPLPLSDLFVLKKAEV